MATHQLAKGLASLGRHGDSMLLHVSPSEVEGLKALGAMTGRKVSTNPHTGMPEAFDFGDFLTSLIPTAVGIALAPETGGASLGLTSGSFMGTAAPIMGGMAAGSLIAGAKGEDPLMGGLMGGLGGYGGSGLGKTLATMGGGVSPYSSNLVIDQAAGQGIKNIGSVQPGVQLATDVGMKAPLATDQFATSLTPNLPSTNVIAGQVASTVPSGIKGGLESVLTGAGKLASDPFGAGYDAFKTAGGSPMQLAAPIGLAALSGAQEDLYPEPDTSMEEKRKAEENKYRDPKTGLLNLAQASPGLKLMATGGTVNTNTSTISSGGIQDLYGTNDQVTGTQNLSKDGYGIGRLENLASEGSRAKAADTFYAMGGPISFAQGGQNYLDGPGDGMSDSIPATIEGKQPARLADGEFVIPADVVSHLGNGSTKAGSKRLYAMLDKVRQARTGTKKQGKQINADKYLPRA
jgi:hypothetical protein